MTSAKILAWVRGRATDLDEATKLAVTQGLPAAAVDRTTVEERVVTSLSLHCQPSERSWELAWAAKTAAERRDEGTVLADVTWSVGCEERPDEAYRATQHDAVTRLHERHGPVVQADVRGRIGGATSAIASDSWDITIAQMFRYYWRLGATKRYVGKGRIRNLFSTIARREAIKLVIVKGDPPGTDSVDDPSYLPNVDEELDLEVLARSAKACMEKLPTQRRRVAELHYLDGLRNGEIAERLETSPQVVANQLRDARQAIRKCMEGKGHGA